MAWLQKRPQVALPVSYYTSGLNTTVVLVGLGNIGKEYDDTRHNAGFSCLEYFVSRHDEMSAWVEKKDLKCYFSSGTISDSRVIAIKPTTFMNNSGESVSLVQHFYKAPIEQIAVVQDELDLDFGSIRTRYGGQDAGHNGIKSITSAIGENYGRIRIGIGPKTPPEIDSSDFVLQKFNEKEKNQLDNMNKEVAAILSEFVYNRSLMQDTRSFIV